MSPVILHRGADSDASGGPRTNVVALLILIGSIAAGLFGSFVARNPLPVILFACSA
jgi:hypothetical protein